MGSWPGSASANGQLPTSVLEAYRAAAEMGRCSPSQAVGARRTKMALSESVEAVDLTRRCLRVEDWVRAGRARTGEEPASGEEDRAAESEKTPAPSTLYIDPED